ncbi:MAG: alpha/beta hydrolase [Streptobacillus sp.]|jgi:lysophospholipase-like protein
MYKEFASNDGVIIPYIEYENNNKKKVILLHGFHDYIDRYDEIAKMIHDNGFDVYVLEYRNHGLLKKDDVADFGEKGLKGIAEDIEYFIRLKLSGVKYDDIIFLGNGLGALLTMYILENNQYKNSVLVSLPLEKTFSILMSRLITYIEIKLGIKKSILNKINGIVNKNEKGSSPYSWLSRDSFEVEKLEKDSVVYKLASPKYFNDIFNFNKKIKKDIKKIREFSNILLVYGDKDPLVLDSKLKKHMQKINNNRKIKFLKVKNGRHLLYNEINKEEIIMEIIRYMKGIK